MPELPEVETIKRGLEPILAGQRLASVDVRVPKLFIGFPEMILNQKVTRISRRAKILILSLERNSLAIHLKMTGQLIFVPNDNRAAIGGGHPDKAYDAELPHQYSHIIFHFENGTLYFNDLRKFGWVKVLTSSDEIDSLTDTIGPEYTWPEYTLEYLRQKLGRRGNTTIKQALLDQSLVAGVGNIYADEALFLSKIHPRRKVSSLTNNETSELFTNIPRVFETSLAHGGTSSQHYRKHDGSKGNFLEFANVYKREGQPCKQCGAPIERIRIAGRSSHFCPICQK
jgi:formamidopyrimidine-DNA glycosylase